MRNISILWLDDEWAPDALGREELEQWLDDLRDSFAKAGMGLNVLCRHNREIWNDLGAQQFDLLIVDYQLDEQVATSNAFHLLDRIEQELRRVPPVIIFSRYSRHELQAVADAHSLKRIFGVFEKNTPGTRELAQCAVRLIASGPIQFLIMSDMHVGYLDQMGGISQERFLDSLNSELDSIALSRQVDALAVCGDFAWTLQRTEHIETFKLLQQIQLKLGLRSHDQVFFCPGNHDIDFSNGTGSWKSFGELVALLSARDEGFVKRFVHRNSELGNRERFHDQASLFSIVHNQRLGILAVGLNSNAPTGNGVIVNAKIDEGQWEALIKAVNRYPKELLRIAILHHPIFSAPGGIFPDELALADQGKALQMFARAGIKLVFHGHAHFGAVHSHKLAVINGPSTLGTGATPSMTDIITVACPSLIAEPNTTTPQRQFLLVRVDTADPRTGSRSLSVESKVFNPADCSWGDGGAISSGQFSVG